MGVKKPTCIETAMSLSEILLCWQIPGSKKYYGRSKGGSFVIPAQQFVIPVKTGIQILVRQTCGGLTQIPPSAQHDNPSKHAADFRDGFLLVEVPGDVVSQPALAESLVNEAESVLAGPFVFWRAFDCLAVPHNLRLAEILKSRFETVKAL
jgi:hypothetical protein